VLADRLDHPGTRSFPLLLGLDALLPRDRQAAREAAERAVVLGKSRGFLSWIKDDAVLMASLDV
jgi:hypothetical protein